MRNALETRQRGEANKLTQGAGQSGQMDDVKDALDRVMQIRSAGTALQTERQLAETMQREGNVLYTKARNESEAFDVSPALAAFEQRARDYPAPMAAKMDRARRLFERELPSPSTSSGTAVVAKSKVPVQTIEHFDNAKKVLDDMIEAAQRQGHGNLGRELTIFKHDLMGGVHAFDDAGVPTLNRAYAEARDAWGSRAEMREALDAGRKSLNEGAEVTIDTFKAMTTAEKRLFRLGFRQAIESAMQNKRPGQDVTQIFQQRRVQDILREIIPRPKSKSAVFADRADRFGTYLDRTGRMAETRQKVLGNSATAERLSDDAQLANDSLGQMWSRFRASPSFFNVGIEAVAAAGSKVLGFRQDVAASLAKKLTTTDPAERARILQEVSRSVQPHQMQAFADAIDQLAKKANRVITNTATEPEKRKPRYLDSPTPGAGMAGPARLRY
jgi:hypothetical protein